MTTNLDSKTIAELRKAWEAATDGEWLAGRAANHSFVCSVHDCYNLYSKDYNTDITKPCPGLKKADAELITAMRRHLSALLETAERNQKALDWIWSKDCSLLDIDKVELAEILEPDRERGEK